MPLPKEPPKIAAISKEGNVCVIEGSRYQVMVRTNQPNAGVFALGPLEGGENTGRVFYRLNPMDTVRHDLPPSAVVRCYAEPVLDK